MHTGCLEIWTNGILNNVDLHAAPLKMELEYLPIKYKSNDMGDS